MLLTTTSVPRAFNPFSQLLLNPREIPTRATTAAIPTEIPKIVSPVRTGRRVSPRVTTVKNVIHVTVEHKPLKMSYMHKTVNF